MILDRPGSVNVRRSLSSRYAGLIAGEGAEQDTERIYSTRTENAQERNQTEHQKRTPGQRTKRTTGTCYDAGDYTAAQPLRCAAQRKARLGSAALPVRENKLRPLVLGVGDFRGVLLFGFVVAVSGCAQ